MNNNTTSTTLNYGAITFLIKDVSIELADADSGFPTTIGVVASTASERDKLNLIFDFDFRAKSIYGYALLDLNDEVVDERRLSDNQTAAFVSKIIPLLEGEELQEMVKTLYKEVFECN